MSGKKSGTVNRRDFFKIGSGAAAAGLIIGYQWMAKSGFNFRLGLGGQYHSGVVLDSGRHLFPRFP